MTHKLTIVMAPAGYGKTTAVLDWLGKYGLPAAWVSVDSYDNNPIVFWRYVCTALDGISNGMSKDMEYVFSSLELMKANIHINILIDRLSGIQSDFLLVLDDLHLITDSSILEGLSCLIDYLPAQMHLLFISRTEPELNLARHRIKWQIQRLEEKDLRFEEEEIFRFYQARGHNLENDDVKKVKTYTEGWAAALVAVAMSMEDAGGSDDAIAALTRSSRDIGQYLKEEVISTWRPEKRSFAMKTCILDTLSEALCDAVTGSNNGHRMLREISEESGFLTAVDNQGQEYRYHPLFKSLLYKLLSETDTKQIPGLHSRAARWFRERGFIPEAIEHLLCAGSYQEAFEIIEHQIDHLINRNDFGTLLSWIERLPAELKDNSFKIAAIYALHYAETGRYDLSRQWIDRMKALQGDYKYASSLQWNNYSRTVSAMVEANLYVREGNLEFLSLLFSAAEADGGRYYKMPEYNDFNTADIYFYRCPVNRIAVLFGEAPDKYGRMIESYRGMISKNPGYAPLGIGEYFYENNRLEEALPHILKALEEAQEANCMGALVPSMVDIARIKRALGDIPGALEAVEECEKKLQIRNKAHWIYLIQAFRCRLYMDMGDMARVEEWLTSRKFNVFAEINRIREYELMVYARALMSKGRLQDAGLLLQRLLSFTEESARLHSLVEVLNLLALLAGENNDMYGAMNYLEKSLQIGMEEGYVRSYIDEPAPMADLLRYYIARRRRTGHPAATGLAVYAKTLLVQIQQSLPAATTVPIEASTAGIKKLLTAQEKKVLELLFKAKTNKEISEKLGISLTTVKTHTGNIYGKLGVKNRSQCIKLIREAG
ncbi:MAG TPA: LuxR C-terminal-related transcriptional regulator, partial [Clostridia bacterium]|nr:LuxR C-terminal-related transcriptional regulator [Clostridia bacterium]